MTYCAVVDLPSGGKAFIRMAQWPFIHCRWCQNLSTKLCDFVVSHPSQVTHKKTCDAPMCDRHARNVGPDRDYCPVHLEQEEKE